MKLQLTCSLLLAATLVIDAKPFDKFWEDCSTADDKTRAEIQSITLDPSVPKKGNNLTIMASFTLKENITSAKADVSAYLDGIRLYRGSFDLCEEVKDINLQCPLSAKQYSITVKTEIPEIAPRGTYSAKATATDQNGKEFVCLNGKFKLE